MAASWAVEEEMPGIPVFFSGVCESAPTVTPPCPGRLGRGREGDVCLPHTPGGQLAPRPRVTKLSYSGTHQIVFSSSESQLSQTNANK